MGRVHHDVRKNLHEPPSRVAIFARSRFPAPAPGDSGLPRALRARISHLPVRALGGAGGLEDAGAWVRGWQRHVVREYAETAKFYRCTTVTGDAYGGQWPRERFAAHGVRYALADKTRSELYATRLPLVNAQRVELLDERRLHAQLLGLERRTARGGRESIDHGPGTGAHDDVANAVAGALVLATDRPRLRSVAEFRNMFRVAR